ncbi:hypothetical protein HBI60_050520 [Parastagonospora nodorum]|nr:hypothetical protein HBI32_044750 [Parastagonospora nodorum]KAH5698445.1 hypothetical protein HBI44_081280 [Parastagonospora nodorum]KAH6403549.1 hypothetical protein HBI60_050520 [Parastagonospora nodorum]
MRWLNVAATRCRVGARIPNYRTLRLVCGFFLALVDNLLEEKAAEGEDTDYGPDLERRLGGRGRDVRWGFVGARGFAGLTQAGGVGARGGEAARQQLGGAGGGSEDGGGGRHGSWVEARACISVIEHAWITRSPSPLEWRE